MRTEAYLAVRKIVRGLRQLYVNVLELILAIPGIGNFLSKRCWNSHMKGKVREINKILGVCEEYAAFIYITDVHWGVNQKKSPKIIKYIVDHTCVEKVIFGGDFITDSDSDKDAMIRMGEEFIRTIRDTGCELYCVVGNHDDNSYHQTNRKSILNDSEIKKILFYFYDSDVSKKSGFNYCFDCINEKTRYLCLDTSKGERNENQIMFVKSMLDTLSVGWRLVPISHIWLEYERRNHSYQPNVQTFELLKILDDYNKQHSTKESASIPCVIGGHIHNDYYSRIWGGIQLLLHDADASEKTCSRHRPVRGLPSEQCVSVVILDYTHNTGKIVRIGRGKNHKFKL